MSDSFEFTLHSPLTKEDWNKISDVEHENTMSVTFQTPQGRQVRYIKCEVLNKIRAEINGMTPTYHNLDWSITDLVPISKVLDVIDKYKVESKYKE